MKYDGRGAVWNRNIKQPYGHPGALRGEKPRGNYRLFTLRVVNHRIWRIQKIEAILCLSWEEHRTKWPYRQRSHQRKRNLINRHLPMIQRSDAPSLPYATGRQRMSHRLSEAVVVYVNVRCEGRFSNAIGIQRGTHRNTRAFLWKDGDSTTSVVTKV